MEWLVIGGGPEAPERWDDFTVHKIITSNRGLKWCDDPDIYWVTDPAAVERYQANWEAYRDCDYPGEIISTSESIPSATRHPYISKGIKYHGRSSGILACRVVLERDATALTLVGFQGHDFNDVRKDIHDKPAGTYGGQAEKRNLAMSKAFHDMAENYPHVKFNFVGKTRIQLPDSFVRIP